MFSSAKSGAVLAAGAAFLLIGCADNTTGSEETLTFAEVEGGADSAPVGNATEGHNPPGRGFSLYIPLQNSSKETVGAINAVCIATRRAPAEPLLSGTCSGMADVPEGQLAITMGGTVDPHDTSGAIVGGTGKYEGATGAFTSKLTGGKSTDTSKITLP